MSLDQSNRYADLSLNEDDLIAGGRHVLCAYIMKPKEGYGYLETASHFAAESSTGTNVEVSTTDDFTRGVDALVYDIDEDQQLMKIAYPIELFDRNIIDGRAMVVSFLTLAVGNNQGMGDVEYAKLHDFYVPPAVSAFVRRTSHDPGRSMAGTGTPRHQRWLYCRDDRQTQIGAAPPALCRSRVSVLAGWGFHQKRRAPRQSGVCSVQGDHPVGRGRHAAGPRRNRRGETVFRQHHGGRPSRNGRSRGVCPGDFRRKRRPRGPAGGRLCRRTDGGDHRPANVSPDNSCITTALVTGR